MHKPFYDPMLSYEDNYKLGPFGAFSRAPAASVENAKLHKNFVGYAVNSTIGIPAGPLLNSKYIKAAFAYGFDLCIYKTVRSAAYACLPFPNILKVDVSGDLQAGETITAQPAPQQAQTEAFSITNSFGVPSQKPEVWQPDMKKAIEHAGKGQMLIASFQGTGEGEEQINDYARTARMVVETGAEVLEANLSCPNEGKSGLLCFDVDKVVRVVEKIRPEIGDRPLMLKMGHFTDNAILEKFVQELGNKVQGLCAINTLPATVVNQQGQWALPERAISGICGASIRWAGLDMTRSLKALRSQYQMNFEIVAGGGVFTPADDTNYRTAGADAVMTATGAMWNPQLAFDIKKEQ